MIGKNRKEFDDFCTQVEGNKALRSFCTLKNLETNWWVNWLWFTEEPRHGTLIKRSDLEMKSSLPTF